MENYNADIIDLTSLDYCFPSNNNDSVIICDEIIDLVNESIDGTKHTDKIRINKRKSKVTNDSNKKAGIEEGNSMKVGHCSICWDKLGTNPLASTKCGHVFCLACLEKTLKLRKCCPTCRQVLKGASAYHPLYLELG